MNSKKEKNEPTEIISDMEAEVMKAVWVREGTATYGEIRLAVNKKYDWGGQYIQTLIQRLVKKEALSQEKRDVYYYTALVSEQDYTRSKTMTLLDRVFDGNAKDLMSALISYNEVTSDDLEDLKKYWKEVHKLHE